MAKVAEYIKQIEIDSLWNGRKHILWNLRKDVNILSGVNGVGKSTILNSMAKVLSRKSQPGAYQNGDFRGVRLTFEPADYTMVPWCRIMLLANWLMDGCVPNWIGACMNSNADISTSKSIWAIV